MSLGGQVIAPGGDVLSHAVDSLSTSSSTLFVVAAGNYGPGATTLTSPGIADDALTVGAVDKSDVLAPFSSRGPRLGDRAIKPDITAPGVNIVAARAAGTTMGTPVDANYTSASGTSMAAPHVAGSAAILKQRHPDWTGQRIKQALTAHSKKADSYTPYQQGYGRVDIPAALDPATELSGNADFGQVKWQKDTYDKVTRTLTLHNTTSADTTLTLAAEAKDSAGNPLAGSALTVSGPGGTDGKVTVPAGGSATVNVVLDPNGVGAGQYTGYVTATPDGGGDSVHTPVVFGKEAEHHDVTIKFTDRYGRTSSDVSLVLHGMDNSYREDSNLNGAAEHTYSLPVGRYSVEGVMYTAASADPKQPSAVDVFDLPEIEVTDKDQTQTVDGTTATDLTVKIAGEKRPLESGAWMTELARDDGSGGHSMALGEWGLLNGSGGRIGGIPSPAATHGTLRMYSFLAQREPLARLSVTTPEQQSIPVTMPAAALRFQGARDLPLVDAGTGSADDFAAVDAKGKAVLVAAPDRSAVDDQVRRAAAAGAKAVIATPTVPGALSNRPSAGDLTVPQVNASYDSGRNLRSLLAKGKVNIALQGVEESGYTYSTPFADTGRIPASLAKTVDADHFVKVRNTFHSDRQRHLSGEVLNAWAPGQPTSIRAAQYVNTGGSRDDYVLADPGVTYQPTVYATADERVHAYMTGARTTYATAGRTYHEDWFAAPARLNTNGAGPCNFCRTNLFTRIVVAPRDSEATHTLTGTLTDPANKWTFYRDGAQITDQSKVMVPEKADYRFVQELTRAQDVPGVALGGKIRTEWAFTSAAPTTMAVKDCDKFPGKPTACESLPAVQLGYDMPLDVLNRASAGDALDFTVQAGHAPGWSGSTAMAGAKVSVSYDDGATWREAQVDRADDHTFTVRAQHPELADTNGFVTLRTEAWDAAGNRTTQTITRAYALK